MVIEIGNKILVISQYEVLCGVGTIGTLYNHDLHSFYAPQLSRKQRPICIIFKFKIKDKRPALLSAAGWSVRWCGEPLLAESVQLHHDLAGL